MITRPIGSSVLGRCVLHTSVHSSTRFTPFFLMFGRQAKLPVDLMYGSSPQEVMLPVGEYVQNLRNTLQNAYALVRERLQVEHQRQKDFYDETAPLLEWTLSGFRMCGG